MVSSIRNTDHIRALAALIQRSVARPGRNRAERRATSKADDKRRDGVLMHIVARARAIDPNHPDRERMALRVFIEGVLLAELGGHLATEPAFQNVVRDVEDTLFNTQTLQAELKRAARALIADTAANSPSESHSS